VHGTAVATKSPHQLSPSFTHSAPWNSTVALVADFLGIGLHVLIFGLNDGSIHMFEFVQTLDFSPSGHNPEVHERIVWRASSGITSMSTVHQGNAMYLVIGLETGTIEVVDCRAFCPEGSVAMMTGNWLVEVDVGGGMPLPTSGWSGPAVCCSTGKP